MKRELRAKDRKLADKDQELRAKAQELDGYKQRPDAYNPDGGETIRAGVAGGAGSVKTRLNSELGVCCSCTCTLCNNLVLHVHVQYLLVHLCVYF